jgi:hypothetical protein
MKKGTAIIGMIVTFLGGYFARGIVQGPASDEAAAPEVAAAAAGDTERLRVPVGLSPFKGARDAKVTIVEFSDFQ